MSSLSALEQIPASCPSSTGTNITTGGSISNNIISQRPETPSPPQHVTRKRKRRNTTMIIKPARWSPPLHHHHPSNAHLSSAPIETDFQPTFYNPNEIKHRRRISSQQYGILEDEYLINTKPNASKRHHLAEILGMTPRTVQIWFQNKRAKAKHQQGKPLHAEKKSPNTPTTTTTTSTTTTKGSNATITRSTPSTKMILGPIDQFTFDDGRLDPIYLMDDYDMATFMTTSFPPSLSSNTPMVISNEHTTNQNSSSDYNDDDDEKKNGTAVMVFTGGQQQSTSDDHGTSTIAPAFSSTSSSPLLPLSKTYDSFTMKLHHPTNTNQHQYYDETPFSVSTASSSPSQQFSPLTSPFTFHQHHNTEYINSTYSQLKENNDNQEQLLRDDTLYVLNWMQKTPMDLPLGISMIPSCHYAVDQSDLQNDCLNFGLAHGDWMDPFSVSA